VLAQAGFTCSLDSARAFVIDRTATALIVIIRPNLFIVHLQLRFCVLDKIEKGVAETDGPKRQLPVIVRPASRTARLCSVLAV